MNSFKKNDLYYMSMPRPTKQEEQGLDLNLIERGQFEPIKVKRDMTILDGYTRWELLGQRGKKIKYEFREFESLDDELNYVVECNVMKRNLTAYQKVEAMLKLFGELKYRRQGRKIDEHKREFVNVLKSIEKDNTITKDIATDLNRELSSVNRLLKQMTEKYYISRKTNARNIPYNYSLMPKGLELLASNPMTKTMKEIGKDIGVDRTHVGKAIYLIENADSATKLMLINGTITVGQAYLKCTGRVNVKYARVNPDTRLKCPHCDHISIKKEFKIV